MAKSNPFPHLFCMLAFLCVSSSLPAQAAESDFFYLTLTWPGSSCNGVSSSCCMPTTGEPALNFLVESMETYSSYNEKMVTNCNTTRCSFYVNQLRNFIGDMYTYWPSVSCPSNNGAKMWESTFCEYGSCSNLTQQQYFQKALERRKDVDVMILLDKKGIVPSDDDVYPLEDIESALRVKYPFSFVLECNSRLNSKVMTQLHKIRYCVSMDGNKFITCPITKESNCFKLVKFPVFTYNMLSDKTEMNPIEIPTNSNRLSDLAA